VLTFGGWVWLEHKMGVAKFAVSLITSAVQWTGWRSSAVDI